MCTGMICGYVSTVNGPCTISDGKAFGHVLRCDGKIVIVCGKPLTNLDVKCGHFEAEVPPGCYVVCATLTPGSSSEALGNHLTHCAIVQVRCNETVCVTLFNPSFHTCGTHFGHAITDALQAGQLPQEAHRAARAAQDAVAELMRFVPAEGFAAQTANLGVVERPNPKPRK